MPALDHRRRPAHESTLFNAMLEFLGPSLWIKAGIVTVLQSFLLSIDLHSPHRFLYPGSLDL